ncbi:HEPN domain-containing protein [Methanoregula sp.]|uniref:HEPN domain-containing protein n=1 Tax=Methanoregula sp. TaxID=2052170 RepID=UPI002602A2A0|nr:HEPN domain-containing protein [Methanoregula sp.]MDD5143761.1 HEPN domain-containing protein [Methanoregula sp.]
MNLLTRLDECYERGLLRKVPASVDKANLSLAQAREWITEAGYDCDADAPRSALIAVYMGYFHAARALLYRDGVREKSHYCIGVYLESYREKGLLEDEWVLQFDHMRGLRQNDQYSLDARPSLPEIRQALADAGEFIGRMELLVKTLR